VRPARMKNYSSCANDGERPSANTFRRAARARCSSAALYWRPQHGASRFMIGGPGGVGGWGGGDGRATRRNSFERGSVERGGSFFVPLLLSIKYRIDRFNQMSPARTESRATLSEVMLTARGDDGSMRGISRLKRVGILRRSTRESHAEERNPTRKARFARLDSFVVNE